MFFSRKNLRALCILLSAAVLHACSSYSHVEVPADAAELAERGAGIMVHRGIEYPIMKPRASEDTLIFSRVYMRMTDGTLGYLTAKDMLSGDRGYRVHVDSSYDLLTNHPVLRVPRPAITKAEMDELNPLAVMGTVALIVLSGLVIIVGLRHAGPGG